jgi:hypothetical protein
MKFWLVLLFLFLEGGIKVCFKIMCTHIFGINVAMLLDATTEYSDAVLAGRHVDNKQYIYFRYFI